jgi:protein O-GlcNAc transferase
MEISYLFVLVIYVHFKSTIGVTSDNQLIDIDLPTNHLSQYFNNLPKFKQKISEGGSGFYKEFLSSENYDDKLCFGYEYECEKPHYTHKCPGNYSGYVESKKAQLDVFYAQGDFGKLKNYLI